jgi:23S rRNA-/tRNA-specific pseudouridylate synthase
MAYLGHPIVGDILYGGEPVGRAELDHPPVAAGARRFLTFAREKEEGRRIEAQARAREDLIITHPALNATLLRFVHPITRQVMTFTAPLHEPVLTLVRELRRRRIEGPVAKEGYWVDLDKAVPRG